MNRSLLHSILAANLLAACTSAPRTSDTLGQEIEAEARRMMALYQVQGLGMTVVIGDQVVWNGGLGSQGGGANDFGAETPCGMYSATKLLTSLAATRLAARGDLDLNAPLGKLRAGLPAAWQGTPTWRLLNHTTGITTLFDKTEFQSWGDKPMTDDDVLAIVSRYPLDYGPGESSRYRQSGYGVFVALASEQLGKPWSRVIDAEVCEPAGLAHTVHKDLADGPGAEPILAAAGNYLTTPADMGRLFLSLNASGEGLSAEDWLKELRIPDRITVDYGLGVIRSDFGGEETWGHSGGGARANVRYAPRSKVGIAIFTDQLKNYGLTIELTDKILAYVLDGAPFTESKKPLAIALGELRDGPVAAMVNAYTAGKGDGAGALKMGNAESALNNLGYYLMGRKRQEDALVLFELNAKEHPESGNVHDSLGEAHLALGHRDKALASYRRAASLDPKNTGALKIIRELEAR